MHINENKIQKFQAGGQFAVYQPLPLDAPQAPAPQPSAGAAAATEAPTLDKSIITKLMGEGIANDVMSFSDSINQAYKEYATLGDFERNTSRGQRLRQVMKGDIGTLNLLIRNKKEFDQSIDKVKSGDAYGELAITARGLVVKNLSTGKLSEISHSDYAKDLENTDSRKFQALTNAELINEREYNPNLVNDKSAINALNSSVGMDTVRKEVTSVLQGLGSDAISKSQSGYMDSSEGPQMAQAIQQLVGMSRKGVYKVEQMSSSETNERQLKSAASAMWQNLSSNARSLLKARAVANGAKPGQIDDTALGYALSLLNPSAKTSSVSKSDVNYDDALSKDPKAGKGGNEGSAGYYESLTAQGGNPVPVQIDTGDGSLLTALGSTSGPLQHNGQLTGATSLRNVPELQAVANFDNAYFGDNKIDPNFINAVVYNGNDVVNVDLPYKSDESIRGGNGGSKPDLDIMPKFLKVQAKLHELPTATAREKYIQSEGLPSDGRGGIAIPTKKFIVFNAMLNDQALGTSNYNKRFVKPVGKNQEKDYERLYRYDGSIADDKKDTKPQEYDRWFGARWTNPLDILQGQVYIEAKVNPAASRFADKKDIVTDKSDNTSAGLNQINAMHGLKRQTSSGVIPGFQL